MNSFKRIIPLFLLVLALMVSVCASHAGEEKLFYAIESKWTICGFSETTITREMKEGKEMIVLEVNAQHQLSAMERPVDTKVHMVFHIDPKTGRFFYHDSTIDQGSIAIGSTIVVEGDVAHITTKPEGKKKDVTLSPDIILDNGQELLFLVKDFAKGDLKTKTYKIFDLLDCNVQEVRFTKVSAEELQLAGKNYKTLIFDQINLSTGAKLRLWVDIDNGYALKVSHPIRTIFLADPSLKDRMKRVNADDFIFAKVNAAIADFKSISFMKARGSMDPVGAWITPESLNVPGQLFLGTVENNEINGVFEVSHKKYDGAGAPPFPPDFSKDAALKKYLEPEDFIESDDPILAEKARAITKDAKDSWEAAKRLSEWVGNEIGYDIPGGGTARKTFDQKEGECGAHSRLLAAFCRAVGIPARVVWGCMYTPNLGGAFGQHGWNEIYMGKAGWIPVDCTAKEFDYVDSGHIRLGELTSKSTGFMPKKMEILDFNAGSEKMGGTTAATGEVPEKYKPYVGSYKSPAGVFTILVRNGSLAVDIPGKMVFELNEPDAEGWWFFKLTDTASISFQKDEKGTVTSMTLWSRTKLPKREGAETIGDDVPQKYRSYLGKYPVPMQNMDLTVMFVENNIAVNDPNFGVIKCTGPDEKGLWTDQFGKNKISFELDAAGNAKAMIFHQILQFSKE